MLLARYSNPDICSPVVKQDSGMVYAQGFAAVILLFVQVLKTLLLLLFLAVAFVLWAWGVSFQVGRQFGRWIRDENPNAWQQTYKFFEMAGFPVVIFADWSRRQVKELLGIELPLLPPDLPEDEKCSNLLPIINNNNN